MSFYAVADAAFIDESGGKIMVSVWQPARTGLGTLPPGAGVVVVGCSASLEGGEVKVNIWPGAHICTTGDQAQSLTGVDPSQVTERVLTAQFAPVGRGMEECMHDAAHPTCAAALADAFARAGAITFQINRCVVDAPLQEELLYTKDGRLFLRNCRLRAGTGGVDVDVVSDAAATLYGCTNAEEVLAQPGTQSLTGVK